MVKIGKEPKVGLDSLRQAEQEKKTGQVGICPKCETEMEWKVGDWGCIECNKVIERATAIRKAHDALDLPPRLNGHTFDNYRPRNKKSVAAKKICQRYAKEYGTGGMILVGGVGTGKTHLAAAMCKAVCDNAKSAHLTTVPRIIRDVRSSWGKNNTDSWGKQLNEEDIIHKYSSSYVFLVIDEIGSQYGSDSEKIIISEIINDRYNNNLPTIILGNVTIEEAEEYLGARVIDRLKDNGQIIIFDWESHRRINNGNNI